MYDDSPVLVHHGIPGQRKGIKHGPPYPIQRGPGGAPKRIVSANKSKMTEQTIKTHHMDDPSPKRTKNKIRVSTLSDDELKTRINRLKMEKEYKDLVRGGENKSKPISEGKRILYSVLGDIGKSAAQQVVSSVVNATLGYLAPAPKKPRDSFVQQGINAALERQKAGTKLSKEAEERRIGVLTQQNYMASEAKRRAEERSENEKREREARRARYAAVARQEMESRLQAPRLMAGGSASGYVRTDWSVS